MTPMQWTVGCSVIVAATVCGLVSSKIVNSKISAGTHTRERAVAGQNQNENVQPTPFNLAWHVSLPAGLADRLCREAGHQSAHGTGRSSGRFDEWHIPDCVGGGVAVCESLSMWIGKKIQTV
jgi:hypothetical protein